jgi:hypothetical protein
LQIANENLKIVFCMSVETPEREPGENKAFHGVDRSMAFTDYFHGFAARDAESLIYASHQLLDADVLYSEDLASDALTIASFIHSGEEIPLDKRNYTLGWGAQSYVYSVDAVKPLLLPNAARDLEVDPVYLRSCIEPTPALIERLLKLPENTYDDRQLRALGKQAIRSMRLPSSRNIFRRKF